MFADTIIATNAIPSFVQAHSMEEGKIQSLRSSCKSLRQRGPSTVLTDAGGTTVIQGVNDSQIHPIRGGLNYCIARRHAPQAERTAAGTPASQSVRVIGGWTTEFQFAERRRIYHSTVCGPYMDLMPRAHEG